MNQRWAARTALKSSAACLAAWMLGASLATAAEPPLSLAEAQRRTIERSTAVIVAGLLPIMWGSATGSAVMRRIAAPMVGGMITAPLLSMFVIPAAYLLVRRSNGWRRRSLNREPKPAMT